MKRSRTVLAALVLALGAVWAADASSRTWVVEKDGSGDFTVIQDAIDAAASGDSILIGPGRYEERPWYDNERFIGRIVAAVDKSNLTLIGAGSDTGGTILGPSEPDYIVGNQQTIGVSFPLGELHLYARGLRFENMNIGFVTGSSGIDIRGCSFIEYGDEGVLIGYNADNILVEDSSFRVDHVDNFKAIGWSAGFRSNNVTVRNCDFKGVLGVGIGFEGGDDLLVENCRFDGYSIAMAVRRAPNSTVRDCEVTGTVGNYGLFIDAFSSVQVEDCDIAGATGLFSVGLAGSTASIERCRLRGGTEGVIRPDGGGDYYIRDCRIERQPGTWFVESYLDADFTDRADMRYNWWGTTDSTEIALGILDGRTTDPQECIDFPNRYYCPRDSVDFWPILDEPPFVSSAARSVGRLKGGFGRGVGGRNDD